MTSPLLVFTTDFGLADAYAGVVKGVALTINPDLRLIDLTHQVSPQNIAQGSFILGINHRFFPNDAIHVAVVDPGVGTARRPLLLSTPWGRFVAPDNGLLSGVITGYMDTFPLTAGMVKPPPDVTVVQLTNPAYWRHPVSETFHGRDVFTPVAAHLSLGVPAGDMGETIDNLFYLPTPQPKHQDGSITGQIIYQDVYGNLVSNIPAEALPKAKTVLVLIKGQHIQGLNRTFNDADRTGGRGVIALAGSHGYLEVAVPNGSAAAILQAGEGETVQVDTVSG
jgi:S-adenosylmethionine hydrolase